ncbi:MAG: T9SS type A sorting domain-containing protein [Edaphocola sp.]
MTAQQPYPLRKKTDGKLFSAHLLFIGCLLFYSVAGYAQNTCQPSPPTSSFTNPPPDFNFSLNEFSFFYQGTDGNLTYKYTPSGNSSFVNIQCIVNNTYTFNPTLGGITLDAGTEMFPWTAGVTVTLLDVTASGDTLTTKWKMKFGTDSLLYDFKLYLSARTLVVEAIAHNPKAMRLTFDRSEGTLNSKIIPIPYLPYCNVLYTDDSAGNKVFVSSFFDWEQTGASEINPFDDSVSSTSKAYSQYARYLKNTNGSRNLLSEKFYLTVSPSFTDVLPNIPNPVSSFKQTTSDYLVWDSWHYQGFTDGLNDLTMCENAGIGNLWVIIHDWQNGGYDNMYPDVVPANNSYGGSAGLSAISTACANFNYLFSLHENYVDFYPNAPSYNTNDLSKDENGNFKNAWFNPNVSIQSYQMKPTKTSYYSNIFSPQIHSLYSTNASYLDVHTSANPSYMIDHDATVSNSAAFNQVLQSNKQLAGLLHNYHQGPVSGEGMFHFLYAGYIDDAEAQINTGKNGGYWQGVRLPLLVDFNLHKIHPLMVSHGVGYYERFFSTNDGSPFYHPFPTDTILIYIATELAYGNSGFIPFKERTANFLQTASLEHKHVLPAQQLYANATVTSVKYDDNGQETDASEYIKNHPNTFDDIESADFMSKVKVTYDNGTVVYVNRHPSQSWLITPGAAGSSYNFHAVINTTDSLNVVSNTTITAWTLPPKSGWLVIAPLVTGLSDVGNPQQPIFAYPNPNNGKFMLKNSCNPTRCDIDIYNVLGQRVYHVADVILNVSTAIDISGQLSGVYFISVKIGKELYKQTIVVQQ